MPRNGDEKNSRKYLIQLAAPYMVEARSDLPLLIRNNRLGNAGMTSVNANEYRKNVIRTRFKADTRWHFIFLLILSSLLSPLMLSSERNADDDEDDEGGI